LKRIFFAAIVLIGIISCNTPFQQNEYLLKIKFKSDTTIVFNNYSRVKIQLWGYSNTVADAPATNLMTLDSTIKSTNDLFEMSFSEDVFSRIVYKSSSNDDFGYYISFAIDINNDSQICNIDYVWDYNKTPMVFYSKSDTREKDLDIYIEKYPSDSCIAF
jgi:hypothetical protein